MYYTKDLDYPVANKVARAIFYILLKHFKLELAFNGFTGLN